ncbi:sensor histidine kinase [Bacillus sp. AK031]
MKHSIIYWASLAILGVIHLQAICVILNWQIPIYITCIFVLIPMYFAAKMYVLQIAVLGVKWNGIFYFIQLTLLLIYLALNKSTYLSILPFLIFIVIEWSRLYIGRKFTHYSKQLHQYEEQNLSFNETFRIVRSERHDFLKHISAIHFLLEKEETNEAKKYLDGLVEGYDETNLSIKGEKGIVAGILNQMYRRAKASKISIVYDLDIPISTLPLSNHDIVGLLGNLLSNSIEACEEWQKHYQKSGFVTVQFYKRGGLYILICSNQSLPIDSDILDHLYTRFGLTTKEDGHEGLGTRQIQDIVNRCQGFLDFVYKDEEFTVKIKIPAIR